MRFDDEISTGWRSRLEGSKDTIEKNSVQALPVCSWREALVSILSICLLA